MVKSTTDTLTLASLPEDVIRTIIKVDCGNATSAARMIARSWNALVWQHFKSLPILTSLLLHMQVNDTYTIQGTPETKTMAHFERVFPTNTSLEILENESILFEYTEEFSQWYMPERKLIKSATQVLNKIFQSAGGINELSLFRWRSGAYRNPSDEDKLSNMTFEILRSLRNVKIDNLDCIGIPIHQSKNVRAMIARHNVFHVGLDLRDDYLTRKEICSFLIDIVNSNLSMHISARCSDAVTDNDWIAFAQQLISEKGASSVSMFIEYGMDLDSTMIGVQSPFAEFMRLFDGYF